MLYNINPDLDRAECIKNFADDERKDPNSITNNELRGYVSAEEFG
jgi:hypothetical protein